jgi:hypothetical protein
MTVGINPPKTPVTAGSKGVASATVPNVCKMPGPPAPFVPTALPNVGKTGSSPQGYSVGVKIEGKKVAIKGASFGSTGDLASKASGGGLVSANTHGPTKFIGPGSMNVKIEGKNVQLLSDPVFNNCGPSGSPPNAATMVGVVQACGAVTFVEPSACVLCHEEHEGIGESEQTKTSTGALATNFEREVNLAVLRLDAEKSGRTSIKAATMLGVVECMCGQKYADQSGLTTKEFGRAADASGMKRQPNLTASYADTKATAKRRRLAALERAREAMWGRLGHSATFRRHWDWAELVARNSSKHRQNGGAPLSAAYPPGNCAAQRALLLLIDDGALPAALTEQWFHNRGGDTGSPVSYFDERGGPRRLTMGLFGPGETVPPCTTCQIILPFLLCIEGKTSCTHKT